MARRASQCPGRPAASERRSGSGRASCWRSRAGRRRRGSRRQTGGGGPQPQALQQSSPRPQAKRSRYDLDISRAYVPYGPMTRHNSTATRRSRQLMREIYLTYLNRLDIEAAALADEEIIATIEASLAMQGRGETVIEPRVHL